MKYTVQYPQIPALVPAPVTCSQSNTPIISLDGTWMLLHTTDYETEVHQPITDDYQTVQVPSSVDRLHYPDFCGAYLYRRQVEVTPEMAASRTVLRMEAVNGFATVYINGTPAAYHENSFVAWNVEITDMIRGCSSFELAVSVDERKERVSSFGHCGIVHSVLLYLLPSTYVSALHATTTFDDSYTDAKLRVDYALQLGSSESAQKPATLCCRLLSPAGETVSEGCFEKEAAPGAGSHTVSVPSPLKWDAEHPHLYTVELALMQDGVVLERVEKRFGFRQLSREGNRLFVNGQEIKLRGSCRHEVTALNGRSTDPALIEQDVRLFKEANCNYIRTSHYPPTEYFLDLCDQYGIYVEDELALAFIARTLDYTQQDPKHTTRYLSHFADVVARDYSHPCVIIWSLCNESFGGVNFDLLNRYAKKLDPTRFTKFSYPMTVHEEYEPVDIWSIHYSNYEADLAEKRDNVSVGGAWGKDTPVVHDEFVHIPCYDRTEHRRDPHIREFWGMSIARFWKKIWDTPGALGGAIWAGIDETDVYIGGNTRLEWGIIDIWRRKKPEHYGTRKAYSPVVLRGVTPLVEEIAAEFGEDTAVVTLRDGKLCLPVENRFCHTNLQETTIRGWYLPIEAFGDGSIEHCVAAKPQALSRFECTGPQIAPFEKGEILLPASADENWDSLYLEWLDACGNLVDEYLIRREIVEGDLSDDSEEETDASMTDIAAELPASTLTVEKSGDILTITGCTADDASASQTGTFVCEFDYRTGLIHQITRNQKPAVTGGPFLHVPYLKLDSWQLSSFDWSEKNSSVQIVTKGSYGTAVDVTFLFTIDGSGKIAIQYTIDRLDTPLPHQIKLRVGVDCGGLDELGITLLAPAGTDRMFWNRQGAYSIYPQDSIGRNCGTATKETVQKPFGEMPSIPWKDDARQDVLNGKYDPGIDGTNDFCSLKGNLILAELSSSFNTTAPLKIISGDDAPLHLRARAQYPSERILSCHDSRVQYSGTWWSMTDSSYESTGQEMWSNEPGAKAKISFFGTGIVWYAPVDVNYGFAMITVDGADYGQINQRIDGVDFPGSAAGFDKKYHYPVFSVTGLPNGDHTLEIEVLGKHASDSCDDYIVLENFYELSPDAAQPVAVHLLTDYNYPHIAWGNWKKEAIVPENGDGGEVILKI